MIVCDQAHEAVEDVLVEEQAPSDVIDIAKFIDDVEYSHVDDFSSCSRLYWAQGPEKQRPNHSEER